MVINVMLAQKVELRGVAPASTNLKMGRNTTLCSTGSDPAKVDRTDSHSVQSDVRSAWRPRERYGSPSRRDDLSIVKTHRSPTLVHPIVAWVLCLRACTVGIHIVVSVLCGGNGLVNK